MRFERKVTLVTGASRSIGRATALRLGEEGADLAVHYRCSADGAARVCEEVRSLGHRAIAIQGDVTDRSAVWRMIELVTRDLGPIDLLVNNAGEIGEVRFDELTPEHWDRMIAVNLTGAFNVIWAVKDSMIARTFGRIVNVSSVAALAVRPNVLPYAAAKAGLISLTKSCCEPLARHNIRINTVAPGVIATDMAAAVSPAFVAQLRSTTPLGRLGEPEEIASVVAFLLSEDSSYVTGATLVTSGGRLLVP